MKVVIYLLYFWLSMYLNSYLWLIYLLLAKYSNCFSIEIIFFVFIIVKKKRFITKTIFNFFMVFNFFWVVHCFMAGWLIKRKSMKDRTLQPPILLPLFTFQMKLINSSKLSWFFAEKILSWILFHFCNSRKYKEDRYSTELGSVFRIVHNLISSLVSVIKDGKAKVIFTIAWKHSSLSKQCESKSIYFISRIFKIPLAVKFILKQHMFKIFMLINSKTSKLSFLEEFSFRYDESKEFEATSIFVASFISSITCNPRSFKTPSFSKNLFFLQKDKVSPLTINKIEKFLQFFVILEKKNNFVH